MKRVPHGFTLVELLVTVAIFGIMLALAAPNYALWIQNSKIRTTAESIQNGLQLARGEAVRRNATIRFQLTDSLAAGCVLSTTATNWIVSFDDPAGQCGAAVFNDSVTAALNPAPRIIQRRPAAESSNVVTASDQSSITFNGLGRAVPAANINVEASTGCASFRCLRVTVSTGGQIRLCDPAYPAAGTDPQRCQ